MINKDTAIRTVKQKRSDSPNSFRTCYVFKCASEDCNMEVIIRNTHLKISRGMCQFHRSILARKRPYEKLYNTLKNKAKKANVNIDLTYEEFLKYTEIKNCHYCSDNINWSEFGGNYNYYLDRKDNTIGYITYNCVVCCGICNHTKGNRFTYNEFLKIGKCINEIKFNRKKTK